MLPVTHRLRKEWEVNKVFKRGKTVFSPFFLLKVLKVKRKECKACVIVTKKYDKRAVKRNALKRRFAEAVQEFVLKNSACNLVILPHAKSNKLSFTQLQEELKKSFEKMEC